MSRGDACRHLGELAQNIDRRIHAVAAGNRERVGTVAANPLPDTAGSALELRSRNNLQIGKQDFTDVVLIDQFTRVPDHGIAARLQPGHVGNCLLSRQIRHLLRLLQAVAERPLAEDRFACMQRLHYQTVMRGHPHYHADEIEIPARDHGIKIMERQIGAECRCGRLGGRLMRSAHCLDLVTGHSISAGTCSRAEGCARLPDQGSVHCAMRRPPRRPQRHSAPIWRSMILMPSARAGTVISSAW